MELLARGPVAARRAIRASRPLAAVLVLATAALCPAVAQTVYPVLVQQVPPVSFGRLSDLTDATAQSWSVTLVLQDTREPSLPVALRVRLTGNRFAAVTLDPLRAPFVTLEPGVPVTLAAADLAPYLAPGNVSVQGASAREFFAGGAVLPEGAYTLCVEVVPVGRAGSVSLGGNGCTMALAQSYDPPEVTVPLDGGVVTPATPQLVPVTWSHIGPAPPGVTYRLEVYDLTQGSGILSVDAAVNSLNPLLSTDVGPVLQYTIGPSAPTLEIGHRYVTRVQMVDPAGGAAIENGGFSRPIVWTYGAGAATGNCLPPANVRPSHLGQTDATLSWDLPAPSGPGYSGYELTLLADGATAPRTFSVDATAAQHYADKLARNTAYTYQLTARCGSGGGSAAPVVGRMRTLPTVANNRNAGCNTPVSVATTATRDALSAGDVVDYRGMGLTLTQVSSGAGTASVTGEGTLNIPWLEQGVLHVRYEGLTVGAGAAVTGGRLSPKHASATQFQPRGYFNYNGQENCGTPDTASRLDANGFTPGGIHYGTGTDRDPYGFDRDGDHADGNTVGGIPVDTNGFAQDGKFVNAGPPVEKTKYDTSGCDREGFDAAGFPCGTTGANFDQVSRDYAAQFGPGTVDDALRAGADYAIQNSGLPPYVVTALRIVSGADLDLLRDAVTAAFAFERAAVSDSLTAVRARLADLTTPDRLAADLGLDRALLFGTGDSLLLEGNSLLYPDGFPVALAPAGRDPLILELERELRERFVADTLLQRNLGPRGKVLEGLDDGYGRQYLADVVRAVVEGLKPADYSAFATAVASSASTGSLDALRDYVLEIIRREVVRQARGLRGAVGFGDMEWERPGSVLPPISWESAWASADPWVLANASGQPAPPKTIEELTPQPSRHPLFGYQLPIKLSTDIDGRDYTIIIDSLHLPTTSGAAVTMDAYAVMPVPGKPGQAIVFAGTKIPFGPGGLTGPNAEAKLRLVSKTAFGLGGLGTLELVTDDPGAINEVVFDCDGFRSFSIAGDLAVCRDLARPVDKDLAPSTDPTERVELRIAATGEAWPNFVFSVENRTGTGVGTADEPLASPFVVSAAEEVVWDFSELVFDYSETDNATTMRFPANYPQTDVRWRGIYAGQIGARLVSAFEDGAGEPVGFSASDLLIDVHGVTVDASATNLVGLEEGKAGSWDFALDRLDLSIDRSSFGSFSLAGRIRLPVDENKVLSLVGGYGVDDNKQRTFNFGASLPDGSLGWDVWDGSIALAQGSGIAFEKVRGTADYLGTATLCGELSLGGELGDFALDGIDVHGFELYTRSPFFGLADGGGLSLNGNGTAMSLGGFGFDLRRLGFRRSKSSDWNLGLDIDGEISLMGGSVGFAAGGRFGILGAVDLDSGDFDYRKLKVDDIDLDVDIPGVEIRGNAGWVDEDDTYGRGFSGSLRAKFRGMSFEVAASATFGSMPKDKGDYRYWFVDAAAKFPDDPKPVVFPLGATAIGGGVSYRMTKAGEAGEISEVNFEREGPTKFGQSFTGITYTPDLNTGLGLRLLFGGALIPNPSALNGDFVLGAELNGLSISRIDFKGTARMMQEAPKPGEAAGRAALTASADLRYGHRMGPGNTPQLHGVLRAQLRMPVDGPVLKGAGTNDTIGQVTFHVDRADHYLWMGTPQSPLGVHVPVVGTVQTYFDLGSRLPPAPQLPTSPFDFQDLLGVQQLTLRPSSSGFMHGFNYGIDESLDIWILKVGLAARAGYNITVTDGFACGNRKPGINGWYAVGNAYAGLGGSLEVRVPGWLCWTCDSDWYKVANLSVMMAGQIEAPNPTFVTGAARVEVDVLNGWYTASKTLRVSLGDRCGPGFVVTDKDSDLGLPWPLIVETTPQAGAIDHPLHASPTATFVVDPDREIVTFPVDGGDFEVRRFGNVTGVPPVTHSVVELRKQVVVRDPSGGVIGSTRLVRDWNTPNAYRWDADGLDAFDPYTEYTVTIMARLVETKRRTYPRAKVWQDGVLTVWRPSINTYTEVAVPETVYEEKGRRYEEEVTYTFTTGERGEVDFVARMDPADGATDVPITAVPRLTLHPGMTAQPTLAFSSTRVRYELIDFKLVRAADGVVVQTTSGTNERRPALRYLYHDDWLDPGTTYDLIAVGELTNKVKGNYGTFLVNGEEIRDTAVYRFTTASAPPEIFAENIRLSYPLPDQHNFYLGETEADCYLSLSRQQEYLWRDTKFGKEPKLDAGGGDTVKLNAVYFDDYTGERLYADEVTAVTSDPVTDHTRISWPRPSKALLRKGHVYRVELRVESPFDRAAPEPVATVDMAIDEHNPFELPYVDLATRPKPVRGAIYTNRFRVSQYSTVAAKLDVLAKARSRSISMNGQLSPDFPAGYTDPAGYTNRKDWIFPWEGAFCKTAMVPGSFSRVERTELRYLGEVIAKTDVPLVEGFDVYEVDGYEQTVIMGRGGRQPSETISLPPFVSMSHDTRGEAWGLLNHVGMLDIWAGKTRYGYAGEPAILAGVADLAALPTYPWPERAIVQRGPALRLLEGQGPDPIPVSAGGTGVLVGGGTDSGPGPATGVTYGPAAPVAAVVGRYTGGANVFVTTSDGSALGATYTSPPTLGGDGGDDEDAGGDGEARTQVGRAFIDPNCTYWEGYQDQRNTPTVEHEGRPTATLLNVDLGEFAVLSGAPADERAFHMLLELGRNQNYGVSDTIELPYRHPQTSPCPMDVAMSGTLPMGDFPGGAPPNEENTDLPLGGLPIDKDLEDLLGLISGLGREIDIPGRQPGDDLGGDFVLPEAPPGRLHPRQVPGTDAVMICPSPITSVDVEVSYSLPTSEGAMSVRATKAFTLD